MCLSLFPLLNQVRDKFQARVLFPQKGSDDDVETITIIGRKENAEAAKAHLQKLIKDLVCVYVYVRVSMYMYY